MQAISALQHTRSIQKIDALSLALDYAGLSCDEIINKRDELQKLYEAHHQLIVELTKNAEDYYRLSRLIRQNYQLQRNKLKANTPPTSSKKEIRL